MGLDVGMARDGAVQYRLSFVDEGYDWFLHPLFAALAERIGIYIDLYGDASFHPGNINHLERLIVDARAFAQDQPETWQVSIGRQSVPIEREIYREVDKRVLLAKLDSLSDLVREVKETSASLVFLGE